MDTVDFSSIINRMGTEGAPARTVAPETPDFSNIIHRLDAEQTTTAEQKRPVLNPQNKKNESFVQGEKDKVDISRGLTFAPFAESGGLFRMSDNEFQEKAINAEIISREIDKPFEEVMKNYDKYRHSLFGTPHAPPLKEVVAAGMVAGAVVAAPLIYPAGAPLVVGLPVVATKLLYGLGLYTGAVEVKNGVFSLAQGVPWELGAGRGFESLTNEQTSTTGQNLLQAADLITEFIGAGVGGKAIGVATNKMMTPAFKTLLYKSWFKPFIEKGVNPFVYIERAVVDGMKGGEKLSKGFKKKGDFYEIDLSAGPIPKEIKTKNLRLQPDIKQDPITRQKQVVEKEIDEAVKGKSKQETPAKPVDEAQIKESPLVSPVEQETGVTMTRGQRYQKLSDDLKTAKEKREFAKVDKAEAEMEMERRLPFLEKFYNKIRLTEESSDLPHEFLSPVGKAYQYLFNLAKAHGYSSVKALKNDLIKAHDEYKMFEQYRNEAIETITGEQVRMSAIKNLEQRLVDFRQGKLEGMKDLQAVKEEAIKFIQELPEWQGIAKKAIAVIKKITPANMEKQLDGFKKLHDAYYLKTKKQEIARVVTRPVPDSVHWQERLQIEKLVEAIEAKYRSKATHERRASSRDAFERYPEAAARTPTKKLQEIGKDPLEDIPLTELLRIKDEVGALLLNGRLKLKAKRTTFALRVKNTVDEIVTNIMGGKAFDLMSLPRTAANEVPRRVSKKVAVEIAKSLNIFERIDGKVGQGPAYENFHNKPYKFQAQEIRERDRIGGVVKSFMDGNKIKPNDVYKEVKIGENYFTIDELMHIYAVQPNPDNVRALIYQNNIAPAVQRAAVKWISRPENKKFRALADKITSTWDELFPRLQEVRANVDNFVAPKERGYVPMVSRDLSQTVPLDEVFGEFNNRAKWSGLFKGMTEARIDRANTVYDGELEMGLFGLWQKHMPKHLHYIENAEHLRFLNGILGSKKLDTLSKSGKSWFTPEYKDWLQWYTGNITNPQGAATQGIDSWMAHLRGGVAASSLVGNAPSIMRQFGAWLYAVPEAGLKPTMQALTEMANPRTSKGVFKWAMKEFPNFHDRVRQAGGPNLEMFEARLQEGLKPKDIRLVKQAKGVSDTLSGTKELGKKVIVEGRKYSSEYGMLPQIGIDAVGCALVLRAKYLRELPSKGHTEAIRLARDSYLRTQQQFDNLGRVKLQSTETGKWLSFMGSQIFTDYNYAVHTMRHGDAMAIATTAVTFGMMGLWEFLIQNGRLPSDTEDVKEATMDAVANKLPVVGRLHTAAQRGLKSGLDILPTAKPVLEALSKKEWEAMDITLGFLESFASGAGLPVVATKRTVKAIDEKSLEPIMFPARQSEQYATP